MKILHLTLISLLFFFISCSQENEIDSKTFSENSQKIITQNSVTLGRKLENPYSVTNMKKAYEQLSPATRAEAEDVEIEATHLYVKFSPQTEEELDILKADTTLNLYPYPLDYEIIGNEEGEDIYVDFTEKDGKPCPYYASVKVTKKLPQNISYEILEELFIPDEDSDNEEKITTRSGKKLNEDFIETWVDESLKLTGNLDPQEIQTKGRSKWRPSGMITYYDEIKGMKCGVEGLKVKAKRWFTTHTGFVNEVGNFTCDGRFKRKADYSFDFERADFHVRDMKVSRKNLRGPWFYNMVRKDSKKTFPSSSAYTYSVIFRAAYHYCYKDIQGLHRPPTQHALRAKIKIDPVNKNTEGLQGKFINGFFMGISAKHIEIYNHDNPIDEIYGTTIHELAHSAHWARDRKFFNQKVDGIVKESWARGVQLYLTRKAYPEYIGGDYCRGKYTGIVEDLINKTDIIRKSNYYIDGNTWKSSYKTYKDRLEGYTLKEIEDALTGVATWEQWKNNIKLIKNNTKQYVDEAFAYWNSGK